MGQVVINSKTTSNSSQILVYSAYAGTSSDKVKDADFELALEQLASVGVL